MTSLHPKLSAVLALIVVLASAAKALFDGDPNTNPDWPSVVAAVSLCWGLFSARQNNVTSEQAGAK
jgi:hypothetical protein